MIEGIDEWEREEAVKREKHFNSSEFQKRFAAAKALDAAKVGSVMTEEEMVAEESKDDDEPQEQVDGN